mgnify:CR=1 FL=1
MPCMVLRLDAEDSTGNKSSDYVLNDVEEINKLINLGVDGIMTDNISVLKEILIKKNIMRLLILIFLLFRTTKVFQKKAFLEDCIIK